MHQPDALRETLRTRFDANMPRHAAITWADVEKRFAADPAKLRSLGEMERTGGEPDVIVVDSTSSAIVFCDCSPETPAGRRSLCYDRAGLLSRKEARPIDTAIDVAAAMGVEMLDEDEYRALQKLGSFDLKTSSWLRTPAEIRTLGGALFGDKRYGRTFVYHNGAQSYYGSRAFRASLRV